MTDPFKSPVQSQGRLSRIEVELSLVWMRSNPELCGKTFADFFEAHCGGQSRVKVDVGRRGFVTLIAEPSKDSETSNDSETNVEFDRHGIRHIDRKDCPTELGRTCHQGERCCQRAPVEFDYKAEGLRLFPIGAANAKRVGWNAYFESKDREASPFPPARRDLFRDYQTGWDEANEFDPR